MINSIDVYVVGFSVLSLFFLKACFAARQVWRQFGLVGLLPAGLVTLSFV